MCMNFEVLNFGLLNLLGFPISPFYYFHSFTSALN